MMRVPTDRLPTHPGEMLLEEFLLPMQLTQRDLATAIQVPTALCCALGIDSAGQRAAQDGAIAQECRSANQSITADFQWQHWRGQPVHLCRGGG